MNPWSRSVDNDELKIMFDKSFIVNNSINESSLNINETLESNSSTKIIDEFKNSQTINSETFISNITDINQVFINDIIEPINNSLDEFQSSTFSIIVNKTLNDIESTTTMTHNLTDSNQTYEWDLLFNDKTETISLNDSSTIATNNEHTLDSNITYQELHMFSREIIIDEDNETFIASLKPMNISICDLSCQCLRQCPYGFEMVNDTCLCNSSCQVRLSINCRILKMMNF